MGVFILNMDIYRAVGTPPFPTGRMSSPAYVNARLDPLLPLDVFTPTGRTKTGVICDLSVQKIDDNTCEFTNAVHSSATPELVDFLAKQGIPWEVFQAARKPISEAHNRRETPLFTKSVECHGLTEK